MSDRWSDDEAQVTAALECIEKTYSGPWGLKASSEDVVRDLAKASGCDFDEPTLDALGEALWNWEGENESPLIAGLSALIDDGLKPGTTVPVAEVAGDGETSEWEVRRAKFLLDLIQNTQTMRGGTS
jgi:hypothetical protein